MKKCNFNENHTAKFEVLVFELQEPEGQTKSRFIGGEGHRWKKFCHIFLCERCLPFIKKLVREQ